MTPGESPETDGSSEIMKIKTNIRHGAAILAAALTLTSFPAAAAGDAEQGKALGYTCLGCHGIDGQRNAYPSYRVPKIGGQKPAYLETAISAYRAGTRSHPTMKAQAGALSEDDVADLVAWIGTYGEAKDTATADQVAGVAAAQICVTCHGVAGATIQPVPPTLAGQQEDYLVQALKQYKDGTRTGTVMNAFAAQLSDADMKLIAGFYASQDGLETLE